MKALSLWQPFASLIADRRKTIETRSWEMLYRGPLAIHATKGNLDQFSAKRFGYEVESLPTGAVVCIVNVVGCVRFPNPSAPPDEFGDFSDGRFGTLMQLVKRFEHAIPAKGAQGLWDWKDYPADSIVRLPNHHI